MGRSLALTAIVAVVLAACGSDDDATSTTDGDAPTETEAPTATTPDSGSPTTDGEPATDGTDSDVLPPMPANTDGADVEAARQFILDNLGEPEFVPNGPAFDMSQVDKPVWFVTATEALPVVQIVNQGFEQAAEAAGVEYNVCPGESTADRTALCIQQAIDAGVGSLIIFSIDPEAVAVALEDAQAAGIKVVSGNNASRIGDPPDPNTDFSVSHDYYGTGLHNGAYAVASWGADTNALCITIPEFKVTEAACEGFTDAVAEYCPECEVTTEAVQVAQIVDQVGAVVNTAVLQNSELNFIYGSVDDVATIALPTLERLDVEPGAILVGGQNGTVDALTAIENGPYMAVSSGQHPFWWGWAFFDATARAQVDGAIGPEAVQTTSNVLFTRESFNPTVDITYENSDEIYSTPGGALYMDGYSSLWTE
jgi:ABC-type sugar transport system substrate-binding protein